MDSDEFKDKVAIITGAASGIGLASALILASRGAVVGVNDVKVEAADAAVARIEAAGGRAFAIAGDISDPEFARQSVSRTLADHGRIDILVNNAGIATSKPALDYAGDWRRILSVDLDAPFYWACEVARQAMIPQKGGAIVNVASLAGLVAFPNDVGYITAKHGVVGLTKALALEWVADHVRVNCICPGFTDTQIIRDVEAIDPTRFVERRGRIPMKRAGRPEEIAAPLVFLLSEAASYMTGVILNVDGGQLALSSGFSVR